MNNFLQDQYLLAFRSITYMIAAIIYFVITFKATPVVEKSCGASL